MLATTGYRTISEAADELHCSRRTVRRAIERGDLLAFRLGPRGQFRIPVSSLERLLQPARIVGHDHEEDDK